MSELDDDDAPAPEDAPEDAAAAPRATEVFEIARAFVEQWTTANPLAARHLGLDTAPGVPPFSPSWWESQATMRREALAAIIKAKPVDDIDERAAAFMAHDLEGKVARDDLGLDPRPSWLQQIVAASEQAETEPSLVDSVVVAVAGIGASLAAVASTPSRWTSTEVEAALVALDAAASASSHAAIREAMAETADDLDRVHAPNAPDVRAIDADRVAIESRVQMGDDIDLAEAMAWATAELEREHQLLVDACLAVSADATVPAAALEHIRASPDALVEGEDAMQRWLRDLMIQTTEAVDGIVLDVPARHRLEVVLTPPSTGHTGYDPPSRDGTRRARVTLPIAGAKRYWPGAYATIAHHEGVPGHHVQMAGLPANADLSAYQQVFHVPAHTEGWAVYAERLMVELGHHEHPQRRFAHQHEQVKRLALAVADLGVHVGGWDRERATTLLRAHAVAERAIEREWRRIVGQPLNRAAYATGLRAWQDARSRCRRASLLEFHRAALDVGPAGVVSLAPRALSLLAAAR